MHVYGVMECAFLMTTVGYKIYKPSSLKGIFWAFYTEQNAIKTVNTIYSILKIFVLCLFLGFGFFI